MQSVRSKRHINTIAKSVIAGWGETGYTAVMTRLVFTVVLLLCGATAALAIEICGNPCEEGYVWTDKDMGKCIPAPPKPTS